MIRMKPIIRLIAISLVLGTLSTGAEAACYVDYKAKRDAPLTLHYGVMKVDKCKGGAAQAEVAKRLRKKGWTLLKILSTFDQPDDERKRRAGPYYLAF